MWLKLNPEAFFISVEQEMVKSMVGESLKMQNLDSKDKILSSPD